MSVAINATRPLLVEAIIATTKNMEPAFSIITKLGGDTAVAAIAGVHRTRVANWKRPKASGGTGGTIPFRHVPKLLTAAQKQCIALTAADFLPAAQVAA